MPESRIRRIGPAPVEVAGNPTPEGGVFERFAVPGGLTLRWAYWREERGARGTVVIVPGRTEFIEKYFETISDLRARKFSVAVIDLRGQGLSDRLLSEPLKGHVIDFQDYVDDVEEWISQHVVKALPGPYLLLAHSMGAHTALRYLKRHGHVFRGAVLTSAMTAIQPSPLSTTFARGLVKLGRRLFGDTVALLSGARANPFAARFEENVLTHDKNRFDRMQDLIHKDPRLALGAPTFGWLTAAIRSMDIANDPLFLSEIEVPILVVIAGGDRIVDVASQRLMSQRLPNCQHLLVDGSHHEVLMETDDRRAQFWAAFDGFVEELGCVR